MFDHQIVYPHVLTIADDFQQTDITPTTPTEGAVFEECSIWGPTCDSIDCVQPKAVLPTNLLQVGDWLRWDNMGAYTICAASQVSSTLSQPCPFSLREADRRSSYTVQRIPSLDCPLHYRHSRRSCT